MEISYRNLHAPRHWVYIESEEELCYLEQDLTVTDRIAFDTETTGLGPDAECFGVSMTLGNKDGILRSYWFNFLDHDDEAMENRVIDIIRQIFTTGKWNVIMQNGKFDMKMVKRTWGIDFTHENYNDTMVMSLILRKFMIEDRIKSKLSILVNMLLKKRSPWDEAIENFFLEHKINQDDRHYEDLPSLLCAGYALEDVDNTWAVFFELIKHYATEPKSLQTIYFLERRMMTVFAAMEYEGMCLDMDYILKTRTNLTAKCKILDAEFQKLWGHQQVTGKPGASFKTSSQQLGRVFFEPVKNGLNLPHSLIKRSPTNQYALDADNVNELFEITKSPMIKKLIDLKHMKLALSKFFTSITEKATKLDGTYRIHTSYFPIIHTGRVSSSGEKWGTNLQNIKNDKLHMEDKEFSVRRAFIAPPGYLYISADFSGFEIKILANACQDTRLVKDCLNGMDFHSTIASVAYNRPYEEIRRKIDSEAITQRTASKGTSFGFIYGGGIDTISKQSGISKKIAAKIKAGLKQTYPEMHNWKFMVSDEAGALGFTWTLCGRKNLVPRDFSYRAVNYICQGTAADLMKYAHIEMQKLFRGRKSKQIATIHDEIHFWLHPEDVHLIPEIPRLMELQRFEPDGDYVPMIVELSMGGNWSDMKETNVAAIQEKLRSM